MITSVRTVKAVSVEKKQNGNRNNLSALETKFKNTSKVVFEFMQLSTQINGIFFK